MPLVLLVAVILFLIVFVARRSERARAKLNRRELDDLRRIYRRDNPRGPGLDPLIHDQQRTRLNPRPKDR